MSGDLPYLFNYAPKAVNNRFNVLRKAAGLIVDGYVHGDIQILGGHLVHHLLDAFDAAADPPGIVDYDGQNTGYSGNYQQKQCPLLPLLVGGDIVIKLGWKIVEQ